MKNSKWINPTTDDLFTAILSLKNIDEARRFFRDLLTEPEILEFANRWKVAQMLSKNISYSKIEEQTNMSTTTIARISKWLNSGMNGYKLMIERINHHHLASAG
ncbi:TrpR-like protein YerC/YecD [Candidatus Roizmanbacteria bacterium]|nr:TrpR-like protein YerC/YecD [Candidatus Roizmanbacteria bacterium]